MVEENIIVKGSQKSKEPEMTGLELGPIMKVISTLFKFASKRTKDKAVQKRLDEIKAGLSKEFISKNPDMFKVKALIAELKILEKTPSSDYEWAKDSAQKIHAYSKKAHVSAAKKKPTRIGARKQISVSKGKRIPIIASKKSNEIKRSKKTATKKRG
jgi:hypothetical protein